MDIFSPDPDMWQPVAGSDDLAINQVSRTILFGRESCLWRDSSGHVHAMQNRCAHRGLRVSEGFVRNGNICCGYHQWQYGVLSAFQSINQSFFMGVFSLSQHFL